MNRRCVIVPAVLITASICLAGCVTYIVPPEAPDPATSVFVVDHGRHTSLLLPEPGGRALIEYTYGDWNWFALDKSKWHDLFPTLLWPTRGALGRRVLHVRPDADVIYHAIPCERVLEIAVRSDDATDLSAQLRARFDRHIDSLHYQPLYDLDFVHSDRAFHLFHNCNHVMKGWLAELGCEVRGPAMTADFEVSRPTDASSQP